MTDKDKDKNKGKDYEIGYRRPPKDHQWPKGQSGNPKGPKKRPRTFQDAMNVALSESVVLVSKNGKKVKTTMLEALMKNLLNNALSNNKKWVTELILKEFGKTSCLPIPEDEKEETPLEKATRYRKELEEEQRKRASEKFYKDYPHMKNLEIFLKQKEAEKNNQKEEPSSQEGEIPPKDHNDGAN